jgi:hypothetical protein
VADSGAEDLLDNPKMAKRDKTEIFRLKKALTTEQVGVNDLELLLIDSWWKTD